MTLSDMQADLYRRLGFAASPDATVVARLLAFLNETQQEILSAPGMSALRTLPFTFASVANQAEYGIPQGVASIKTLREQTNNQRLWPTSLDSYRAQYPNPTTVTGTPTQYVDLGFAAVTQQPSNASTLYADSNSASDTGTAYIEGYRFDGEFYASSAAMTGTTAVSVSGFGDFAYVTKFYLSAAAVGTVTLTEDTEGGTVLATIYTGQTSARSRKIALVPTPASAVTYYIDAEYDIPNLANAKDESILPSRFHRLLVTGARMKEYEKQERWEAYDRLAGDPNNPRPGTFVHGMRELSFYAHQQAVGSPNLRGQIVARRVSQLGGQYPAGS